TRDGHFAVVAVSPRPPTVPELCPECAQPRRVMGPRGAGPHLGADLDWDRRAVVLDDVEWAVDGRHTLRTCPQRADTSNVGVSPRGGCSNGEEGGGGRGTPTAAPGVHAGVQGRGHRLGASGRAVAAGDLSRARSE